MTAVSRDILRAVLKTRDHRHDETHAVLLAMFQGLVTEMVDQQMVAPRPLAERLERSRAAIAPNPHGDPARAMLDHVVTWLRSLHDGLPATHPPRWTAPDAQPDDA